jgi:signal transduction histidine kinase
LKTVNLCVDQNYLNIEFATFNYDNNYSIEQKLEGKDEDWKTTEGNHALYPWLPPGTYTLLLKSKDAEGNEGKNITRLAIKVHPPFWRTWWFTTIMILLTGTVIFAIHKQKVTRLLEIERVRTRVARDLHDDIGSSLSTINILSKVAAQKMKTDSMASKEYMQKISESSGRIMESMDDIIWSINPVNDTMGKVLVRIKEFVAETLEPKEINFVFIVPEEVKELKLDMEARRDFFLIFKEAINNISKYSEAQNVRIEIKKSDNDLNILIADDGKGFDFNEKISRYRGGHGLQNMKSRAQQLKGILNISSAPGKGTCIQLNMQIA